MNTEKISTDDAALAMAAAIVDRTYDLLESGWVKGKLNGGFKGVQEFCIHGAMGLALQEMFGATGDTGRVNVCGGLAATFRGYGAVEAIATAFIVDEANAQHAFGGTFTQGNLSAAPFNDAQKTQHDDVLDVLRAASKRIWALSWEPDEVASAEYSRSWAEAEAVETEAAKNYLYATLA